MEKYISIKKGKMSFDFLDTGDIYRIKYDNILVNQLLGNKLDGCLMNIYLRLHKTHEIKHFPLLGINSESVMSYSNEQLKFIGKVMGINYTVVFTLVTENTWFWNVELSGEGTVDVIIGQDLGLGDYDTVLTNEAYMSQYIDYLVIQDETYGYIINARQNQKMSTGNPAIQLGMLEPADGYLTDGFQFFGLDSKLNGAAAILNHESFPNKVYQYEFAYVSLKSKKTDLRGRKREFVFYGSFIADCKIESRAETFDMGLLDLYGQIKISEAFYESIPVKKVNTFHLETMNYSIEETDEIYPNKYYIQKKDNQELSFFTDHYVHVVLKEKELLVERPHAHIMITGHDSLQNEATMATTSFMYGVFNSQTVLGNSTYNQLFSNMRNHLNLFHNSGQRIYIKDGDSMILLGLPSMFEMGINYAKWYYKTDCDIIEITVYTVLSDSEVRLAVASKEKKKYHFIITQQLILGQNQIEFPCHIETHENKIFFKPAKETLTAKCYPYLNYLLEIKNVEYEIINDGFFYMDGLSRNEDLFAIDLQPTDKFELIISGSIENKERKTNDKQFLIETDKYYIFMKKFMNGFKLEGNSQDLYKMNATMLWFTHNALIHYVSAHGIEQYSGAAWGTRDVCQGPLELNLALGHLNNVKTILQKVYSHQYEQTGVWPQWFMFDSYEKIQQEECHGDIVVWPLKALVKYLQTTSDYAFLNTQIPYTNIQTKELTNNSYSVLHHIKKQIQYIKDNFMPETALSNYGDGDWDDTLQPANQHLKKFLISSWTVALTYETLKDFYKVMVSIDPQYASEIKELVQKIEKDFKDLLIKDEVIAGFVIMEKGKELRHLLHPCDTETGIHYRMLPMTRSIIAELFTEEEANTHIDIIDKYLDFPDGIRLMDHPVNYRRGVTKHFKRGELAANFGREIGLLYVHANVRYSEAMTQMGLGHKAFHILQKITPIGLETIVPNAMLRQSNVYFSSSDGDFKTRFEVNFDQLHEGSIGAKGGWRLYSSGPGIYVHQFICNCVGIRRYQNHLIIDPVLPEQLDRLFFTFHLDSYIVKYEYYLSVGKKINKVLINKQEVRFDGLKGRYKSTGVMISKDILDSCLQKDVVNTIQVYS